MLAAYAGPTARVAARDSVLADLPGRWDNLFVDVTTAEGPLRMHYLAAGPKDAPRVVLLHGFPDFSYSWREGAPLLARDHRVLAPDLRGDGATGKPKAGCDLDTLAADILGFAGATARIDGAPEGTPTHLVGHDWGAAVGWWAVMAAPQRFASYTAISVAHPRAFTEFLERDDEQRKKSRYMRRLTIPGVPAIFAGMSDKKRRGLYRDQLTRKDAFGDNELVWYRVGRMHGHPAAGSPGGDPRLFAGGSRRGRPSDPRNRENNLAGRRGQGCGDSRAAVWTRPPGPGRAGGRHVAGGGEVDPLLARAALVELRCEERGVDGGGGPIVRKDILDLEVLGRHRATQTQGGLHGEDLIRIEPRS